MARRPAHRTQIEPARDFLGGIAFLGAAVLALLVPLVWSGRTLDAFRGPQSELALAAWWALAAVFAVTNLRGQAWRDAWGLLWACVAAGGLVSALAGGQAGRSLFELAPLVLAGVGWGALRQLDDRRRALLANFVIAAAVIEAVLVLAFLVPDLRPASIAAFADPNNERYRWIGTLGNPGYVGAFLTLPALLTLQRAIADGRRRWLHVALAALLAGTALGTRTLSAALAIVAGVIVLLWRRTASRLRLPLVAGVVLVALVATLVTPLRTRVAEVTSLVKSGGWLWLGSARGAGWAAALNMLAARPITGVGYGLFEANSFRFQSEQALAERGRLLGLVTGFGEAHNEALQYAAETGVVGILLALAGAYLAWRYRVREEGLLPDPWPLAVAASVLALTHFPLHLATVAGQWAILAALAAPPLAKPEAAKRGARWARTAAALALVAAGGALAWQRYAASVAIQQGVLLAQAIRQAGGGTRAREVARTALTNLEARARWLPYNWQVEVGLGNLAVDAHEQANASAHFDRALALVERPEVQYNVGMSNLMVGNHDAGLTHLMRAVELNPAIFHQIKDARLARELRQRLDASGYGRRNPWIYEGTPAATE